MKQTLRIDNIPPNLNRYRNMHYYALDKEKKEWEEVVGWLVKEQKIMPHQKPIRQVYEFYFKDKREHDPDNYACCAKFINDGLVSAGVLARDNFDHIKEFTVRQGGISRKPYILVHMEEMSS